jgi:glycerophosphoryl diester phosphodiesterase
VSRAASPVRLDDAPPPFVWAHRGASDLAPENTLEAFLLAGELGADGIELDVRLTRDGVPVLVHDRALWSDGTRLHCRPSREVARSLRKVTIAELEWSEIEHVPIVHRHGATAELVRLEAVLAELPSPLWVDIEIKGGRDYDPRIAEVVLDCMRLRPERVLVSSFDHVLLHEFGRLAPAVPLLAICHARLATPSRSLSAIPTTMISVDRPFLALEDVVRWREEEGLEVSMGALQDPSDIVEVLDWPLSGIFVDNPRLARRAVPGSPVRR